MRHWDLYLHQQGVVCRRGRPWMRVSAGTQTLRARRSECRSFAETAMSIDSVYHRVLSPHLRDWVCTDAQFSTPVGLLACQRDPLLRQLDVLVVSSVVSSPPPLAKGKATKKAVIAPTIAPDAICLEVCLNDTVIFPEGGAFLGFSGACCALNAGGRRPAV